MTPKKMNLTLKIMLGLIVVLTCLGLYFANQKLTKLALDTAKLKADIEVTNQKLSDYELTQKKVEELSYVKDLAAEIVPQSENQSAIVAELAEFAHRANLQTGAIAFEDTTKTSTPASGSTGTSGTTAVKPPDGVVVVPVTFSVSGSAKYSDVLSFLRYMEDNRRKMQVTQIALTPNGDDGNMLDDVTLSINLFVKKPASQEAKK